MFTKKTLALGVAAALGVSVSMSVSAAAYDLDNAPTSAANTFALESLDTTLDGTTVGTDTYPNITADGTLTDFDVVGAIGVGVSNTEDLFIRYDLSNAVFATGSTLGFTTANATDSAVQGGTAGSSFVIFQVSATADIPQSQTATMDIDILAATDVSADIGVQMRVFETLTQAVSEGTALTDKSSDGALAAMATGLSLTATAATANNTADVETDFEEFVAGTGDATVDAISSSLANIGSASVSTVANVASADDGEQVTLGDMIDDTASAVTISGAFPLATDSNSIGLDSNANCATALAAITATTDGTASTGLFLDDLNAKSELCYTAGGDAIPEGSYSVSVALEPAVATKSSPTASLSGTMGAIQHNGTTVQLPYLTTFSDYNQRIVMVNRGSADADYSVSNFQTESDTTAVAGTAATGTIPAGGSAVVKVSDVVTLTGKTRTAATVNIVAATGNISVATTQVNLADSSTDTIVLQ
jgi:hypothetical protein